MVEAGIGGASVALVVATSPSGSTAWAAIDSTFELAESGVG